MTENDPSPREQNPFRRPEPGSEPDPARTSGARRAAGPVDDDAADDTTTKASRAAEPIDGGPGQGRPSRSAGYADDGATATDSFSRGGSSPVSARRDPAGNTAAGSAAPSTAAGSAEGGRASAQHSAQHPAQNPAESDETAVRGAPFSRRAADHSEGPDSGGPSENPDGHGPDDQTPEPAPRKSRRMLWVALVALLVVILVVGALGLRNRIDPGPPPRQPGDVAVEWMNAMAAGNIDGANALVQDKPRGPLTTTEAWQAQLADKPITDVKVAGSEPGKVTLQYNSGGEPTELAVPMVGEGVNLKVRSATSTFVVTPKPELLPMTVDGEKVSRSEESRFTVELFPGTHQISTGSRWLQYTQTELEANTLGEWTEVDGTTVPSAEFEGAMRARVTERIDKCLTEKSLAPQGCPWAFSTQPGDQIDPQTITWKLDGELTGFAVKPPGEQDALVDGEVTIPLSLSAQTQSGGRLDQKQQIPATFRADMLTEAPDFIWLN